MKRVLAAVLGLGMLSTACAQVLLTVDISDPSAVTFTATGLAPSANDNTVSGTIGFTLLGFLTSADDLLSTSGLGDLEAPGMTSAYDAFAALDYAGGVFDPGVDINLWGGSGVQNFSTGAPAFTGTFTIDLTAIASLLPSAGHSGTIQVGDGSETGAVIGQYQVVPEPSAVLLTTLACGTVLIFRRRR